MRKLDSVSVLLLSSRQDGDRGDSLCLLPGLLLDDLLSGLLPGFRSTTLPTMA